jgi:hypothetical protein
MPARSGHPRVVALSCRLYGLLIYLYPASLRREYKRELLLTFRNRAEDVVNTGSLSATLRFMLQIAVDWLRTLTLPLEPDEPAALSLLGLGAREAGACGCVDESNVSVSLMLASLGVVLLIAGWYWWLNYTAAILSHHQSFLAVYKM